MARVCVVPVSHLQPAVQDGENDAVEDEDPIQNVAQTHLVK